MVHVHQWDATCIHALFVRQVLVLDGADDWGAVDCVDAGPVALAPDSCRHLGRTHHNSADLNCCIFNLAGESVEVTLDSAAVPCTIA